MSGEALVFEDAFIVAANKPAGQPSIPGRGEVGEALNKELERRLGVKLFVVHRLDREASGLIVFAKDADTHRALCAAFEDRKAHKTYLAAVLGTVSGPGEVKLPLKEFGSGRVAPSPQGKPSRTRWTVEAPLRGATLLRVEPVTGRKHQIRAHLCAIGHPILGDPRYGDARPVGGVSRLLLHALSLKIEGARPYDLRVEPGGSFESALKPFRR